MRWGSRAARGMPEIVPPRTVFVCYSTYWALRLASFEARAARGHLRMTIIPRADHAAPLACFAADAHADDENSRLVNRKTTVCAYSLRAKEKPRVSTPVTWDEVRETLKKRDPDRLTFLSSEVLRRVENFGDLFEPVLKLKQNIPKS